jgi:putative transcriptional regulator
MSGKDNHRARVEKNLEDMMDRDWRLFRAKLVAQEAHEAQVNAAGNHRRTSDNHTNDYDEKQVKQEKFGNIFAAFFHSKDNDDNSIFNGDTIGGAAPGSMIPDTCEDPFVSKDELPVLLQPKVQVNKHRWAHSLSHIEPGCVLIANEKLGGVFHQTVVLVIEHSDVTGSTGIIINR